jgi:hypothetical protein
MKLSQERNPLAICFNFYSLKFSPSLIALVIGTVKQVRTFG